MIMKKILFSFSLLLMAMLCSANNAPMTAMFAAAQTTNSTAEAVDNYGFMTTPDGATWTYTLTYHMTNNRISGLLVKIYDENKDLVGIIDETIELLDTDLWVRDVTVNSIITKKFFNRDDSYEVMIWLNIATKDYVGRYINNVYSIGETASSYVCSVEGSQILAKNTSTFANDNYTMVFWRQEYQGDTLSYNYDVYTKATIGTVGPKLAHTFKVPYQNIAALNDPMPLMMFQEGTELSYIVSMYEKPYFVGGTSIYEEPVVNENNHFVITHYDSKFNVTKEVKIPMAKDPSSKYLYSFYYLGSLDGQNDVIKNYDGTGKTAYVITVDNYEISSDGSVYSYYLYDDSANRIATIAEHCMGTPIYMSNVEGQPKQYAFLMSEDDEEKLITVDVPSCERVADIALFNGGATLSGQWDRVPYADSYRYVSPLLQGDNAADGSVLQRIAWFNKNGRFLEYDTINMGKRIEYAQLYIYGPVLNPRLFDYDNANEYVALVKRTKANSKEKEEALLVCNDKGEILLDMGADPVKGVLNTIDVINLNTMPALFCSYYGNDGKFTVDLIPLPLNQPEMKGQGTPESPYQIASVEDWLMINSQPTACYEVVEDIDFANIPVKSQQHTFSGILEGNLHTLHNLCLQGGGLFNYAVDTAVIRNLVIDKPSMVLTQNSAVAGIIANTMRGGYADNALADESSEYHAVLSNIHVEEPTILANGFSGLLGGLVGDASLFLSIESSSMNNTTIVAPDAEQVGGIAGTLATSASVQASLFTGSITGGQYVGGIVAKVGSADPVFNCRVDAQLSATNTVGGVVAYSERSAINNCVVSGNLTLTSMTGKDLAVGGILGNMEEDAAGKQTDPLITNCLVNIDAIQVPEGAEVAAHRIIGFSSVNKYEYDWDKIDWSQPQDQWPRIYGSPEKCLKNNYVISSLAVLDASVADADNTTEGATLAANQLSAAWLTEHGFALGQSIKAPWVYTSELLLWYEVDGPNTDVEDVITTPEWTIENGMLNATGVVKVYNLNGILMAQGMNTVGIQHLPAGVYVVAITSVDGQTTSKILLQ